ncbi:MAG: NAD(P)/FAD-dependent oxidoreductase [Candidatus Hatepunaea meridiana]|nr:NAD(P)/FAD-dependent oxidoreductase [Candidatus Hatepunaea meridiana]
MSNAEFHKVTVVGAGPAGIAAAIQLTRYGIKPVVFEGNVIGGLVHNANRVENYPGFPKGIHGHHLAELFTEQLVEANIEVQKETVLSIAYLKDVFHITTDHRSLTSQIVLLATGTLPRVSSIPGVQNAKGKQVFYEVFPLYGVQGKRIAIVGAGDAAFDYALNLARNNSIVINNRGINKSCLPLLEKRASENKNISYRKMCVLNSVVQNSAELELMWKWNDNDLKEHTDYLLFAIGRVPNLELLDESTQNRIDELEAKGLMYKIGDVKNGRYRQVSISVGDGVKAAMMVQHKLGCVTLEEV